jgi:hypothetical protein
LINGDLGMIDVEELYIYSLKISWIRRILLNNDKWISLVCSILEKLIICGLGYIEIKFSEIKNGFWKGTLTAYYMFCKLLEANENELFSYLIFYNPLITIGNQPAFFKTWFNAGEHVILGDLLKPEGHFYGLNEFNDKYNINSNFVNYLVL